MGGSIALSLVIILVIFFAEVVLVWFFLWGFYLLLWLLLLRWPQQDLRTLFVNFWLNGLRRVAAYCLIDLIFCILEVAYIGLSIKLISNREAIIPRLSRASILTTGAALLLLLRFGVLGMK